MLGPATWETHVHVLGRGPSTSNWSVVVNLGGSHVWVSAAGKSREIWGQLQDWLSKPNDWSNYYFDTIETNICMYMYSTSGLWSWSNERGTESGCLCCPFCGSATCFCVLVRYCFLPLLICWYSYQEYVVHLSNNWTWGHGDIAALHSQHYWIQQPITRTTMQLSGFNRCFFFFYCRVKNIFCLFTYSLCFQ